MHVRNMLTNPQCSIQTTRTQLCRRCDEESFTDSKTVSVSAYKANTSIKSFMQTVGKVELDTTWWVGTTHSLPFCQN